MNDTTITIVGNLTDTPELRHTESGIAVARFTVASTPRVFDRTAGGYRDGDPLFLLCQAWRDLADNLTSSLTKGTRVVVTGRLTQNTWTTDTGEKRTNYLVQVEEIGPSLRFATATVTKTRRTPVAASAPA